MGELGATFAHIADPASGTDNIKSIVKVMNNSNTGQNAEESTTIDDMISPDIPIMRPMCPMCPMRPNHLLLELQQIVPKMRL